MKNPTALLGESKLVTVAYGSACGAYVDTRPNSKTFGVVQMVH